LDAGEHATRHKQQQQDKNKDLPLTFHGDSLLS
jgi:hypothetical protein